MEIIRSGLAFGDAKYDSDVDISTPKGALKYLPAGVMYFLFSPLPWQMTKLIHFLTIPELFIWYYVLFLAIDGAIVIFKHRYTDSFFPIILILNLTITFALVEANFGTAYRHRSQTIVFFLMIAAFNYYQRKKN
jgi:hypothetical protein